MDSTPEGTPSPTAGPGNELASELRRRARERALSEAERSDWRELYEESSARCGRLRAELELAGARYDMLLADLKRHRRSLNMVQALVGQMLAREKTADGLLEGGMHHADALLGGLRPRRDPALPVAFPEQYDRQPFMVPETAEGARKLRPPMGAHQKGPCGPECYEEE